MGNNQEDQRKNLKFLQKEEIIGIVKLETEEIKSNTKYLGKLVNNIKELITQEA